MSLLAFAHVTKSYGTQPVLDSASFRIERGDKVALVGANGAGKSTVLRIIAGTESPDGGTVTRTRSIRIAYLPQDPHFVGSDSLYDVMMSEFHEVVEAQERLRILENEMVGDDTPGHLEEYATLQSIVEHAGYDYRQRLERVLLGLDLSADLWGVAVGKLSGGQRTRANLARTLLQDADILLLDEPTNHLDIPAVEWLESYLQDVRPSFVIVAHDRYLLDRVTRRTLELDHGTVMEYDAPYSRYLELRAERLERQKREYEEQQRHITKTEEFVRRYGAGQRYKEARGRQKQLDRLERVARPQEQDSLGLRLDAPARSGEVVLELRSLLAGYPGHPLVQMPEHVVVRRAERIAIIGSNGSGKTTLLRTFVDGLPPLSGDVRWGSRVSVAYYSQSIAEMPTEGTILEEVRKVGVHSEEDVRGFLGRFLFSGDDVHKKVSILSGGERSRVALAKLILSAPNVLLLDEPTNHLDIGSRDALESVLREFSGTLMFVSHDRYLIDSLAQSLWLVHDGKVTRYHGTYQAYAGGTARPQDWTDSPAPEARSSRESPELRVRELSAEAEVLAGRLAEAGRTTSLAQLAEMTERYADNTRKLEEAQATWVKAVRERLHSFSG
ncbi:MAG: ABC-F family ATP-binding cassette domain-containing protein [Chloroflexota bacterium]